jgi:hypothetical protein
VQIAFVEQREDEEFSAPALQLSCQRIYAHMWAQHISHGGWLVVSGWWWWMVDGGW